MGHPIWVQSANPRIPKNPPKHLWAAPSPRAKPVAW